jgi:cytochrome c-type biogenesis protein CcsB
MNRLLKLLISPKLTLVLLLIFAVAIGVATFIENAQTTLIAKQMVYNAKWFEVLILLIAVNLVGVMLEFKLFSFKRIAGLILHLSFLVIILGAAVTRYIGYEGTMHIREGSSSNVIYGSVPYLTIKYNNEKYETPVKSSNPEELRINEKLKTLKGEEIIVTSTGYIRDAEEVLVEGSQNGEDYLEFTTDGHNMIFLKENEITNLGGKIISFNNNWMQNDLFISKQNEKLVVQSFTDIEMKKMDGSGAKIIEAGTIHDFIPGYLYKLDELIFLFNSHYRNATKELVESKSGSNLPDVIKTKVKFQGVSYDFEVSGGPGYIGVPRKYEIGNEIVEMYFGDRSIELPFSLYLNDFILERYPGSSSPSSFESSVTLIDEEKGINEQKRIYMNNVLDHRGYRFFQSSYDKDEKGTILSVNHDKAGTLITYFGYFLMGLGFILLFFYKESRFYKLLRSIKQIRMERKSMLLLLFMSFSSVYGISQNRVNPAVTADHADEFGSLIVQTMEGRFQPLHTLSTDIVHKVTKQDKITTPEKGKINAMQFYMDLILDSEYWKRQDIIYIKDKSIRSMLGVSGEYASFYDFYDQNSQFKLRTATESAYRKDKEDQTQFDKELIKVSERVNILIMTFNGTFLKIFPLENAENNDWVAMDDQRAYKELTGSISILNEDLNLKQFNYISIINLYFDEVVKSLHTGNYDRPSQILGYLKNIQRNSQAADILPSESKLKLEIQYNKAQIFDFLKTLYNILSVILLLVTFIESMKVRKNKILIAIRNITIVFLSIGFLYHTYGLVLRWYLSGHAPWSNGYEVLIFVAWVCILAGLIFIKYSKITLAATSLLAFLILMVAGFSSYDPQITNLQPVLKSYWLIIHVAAIVISYGFLGLGFILGFMNLLLTILKNKKNQNRLNLTIRELTCINEMNLILGLILATLGTFLGAVWANESWGRYWGWDAKETWALIILIVYSIVLHFRLVPKLKSDLLLNIGSVVCFGTVIMTFFGVNYYFSKGLHSYASGGGSVFPTWAWIAIVLTFVFVYLALAKEKKITGKYLN